MNKTVIALIVATLIVGFVGASVLVSYYYPNRAQIASAQLTQYLDGAPWSNGTMIDWGDNLEPDGTYQFSNLTVHNTGTRNITAYIITEGLPNGWTYLWGGNNTFLQPDEHVSASLTLYVATNATEGAEYFWGTHVNAEEA